MIRFKLFIGLLEEAGLQNPDKVYYFNSGVGGGCLTYILKHWFLNLFFLKNSPVFITERYRPPRLLEVINCKFLFAKKLTTVAEPFKGFLVENSKCNNYCNRSPFYPLPHICSYNFTIFLYSTIVLLVGKPLSHQLYQSCNKSNV